MTATTATGRKVVVCFDGTNNEIGSRNSNVIKIYRGLKKDSPEQDAHYVMGVGTEDGTELFGASLGKKFKGIAGMAFGLGLEDDVLDAYRYICRTFPFAGQRDKRPAHAREKLYIIGFSRGAYGARLLAAFIHNFGLVAPERLHLIVPVFRAFRRISQFDKDATHEQIFLTLRQYEEVLDPRPVPIRGLVLFDTVSSLIRANRPFRNVKTWRSLIEFGTHPNVDSNVSVRIVIQALAVDERRTMFRPQLWDETGADAHCYYGNRFRHAAKKRRQYVRQCWFPGFHGDIGGSVREAESGIGKITLMWALDALKRAEIEADREDRALDPTLPVEHAGLIEKRGHRKRFWQGPTTSRTPDGQLYVGPDPFARIHDSIHVPARPFGNLSWLLLEIIPKTTKRRAKGRRDWFRALPGYYLPLKEPRYIPPDHELHPSIATRMSGDPTYRPENLP